MNKSFIKTTARDIIKSLVDDFQNRHEELTRKDYKEDRVRKDFIDKFFSALGWDMYNEQKLHENQREVIHEDVLRIKGKPKAPDYAFRIGRSRKFYVEAKAPWIDLENSKEPAYQVRLYGYNRKLPISILTDFEEFCIYDTKYPPKEGDETSVARIFYCRFVDYLDKFDEICYWCSKDALYDKNSQYNKFAEKKIKKGELSVDDNFLKFLTNCRSDLAGNIANRNKEKHFDEYQFNFIVQTIIDRIIFLRIAEDRAIEKYQTLLSITKEHNIYDKLNLIFKDCEERYNSSLFYNNQVLNDIQIDDNILKKIIKGLYYPNPYEFSVMPVEIIGSIYEQFLGSIIRVLPAGGVKVEQKAEIQKAGGVYYTPQYIVEHIIQNTIGVLLKNYNPESVSDIKILDPSCGSGSFLIGAYDYLLNWHLEFYTKNKTTTENAKKKGLIYEVIYEDDETKDKISVNKLSVDEKKRILLNNIYGVDIDPQAVEVTKLSLILKMLEDENYETRDTLFENKGVAVLPDLSVDNIKCGNSLISTDYYQVIMLLKKELQNKLNIVKTKNDKKTTIEIEKQIFEISSNTHNPNPFDWGNEGEYDKETNSWLNRGFPNILKNGGFDVIIGNPPYGSLNYTKQSLKDFYTVELHYWSKKYNLYNWRMNFIMLFYEMIFFKMKLLKENCLFGMIIDFSFLDEPFQILRDKLLQELSFKELIINLNCFSNVSSNQVITILQNSKPDKENNYKFSDNDINGNYSIINQKDIIGINKLSKSNFVLNPIIKRIDEMDNISPLGELYQCTYGAEIGGKKDSYPHFIFNDILKTGDFISIIDLDNFDKYSPIHYQQYLRYDKNKEREITKKYPKLNIALRDREIWKKERIILRQSSKDLCASIDFNESTSFLKAFHIYCNKESPYSLKYLLGLLNSRFLDYYTKVSGINMSEGGKQPQIRIAGLRQVPIIKIDFSNENHKNNYNNIVELVDEMLEIQNQYCNTNLTQQQRTALKQQIDFIYSQIDRIVYELYRVSEDEIERIKRNY